MKGFNQCTKGHFFKEDIDNCPYCPKGSSNTNNNSSEEPRTEIIDDKNNSSNNISNNTDKTQIFGGDQSVAPSASSSNQPHFDPNKTIISGMNEVSDDKKVAISRRKLRGWLVSFDLEDYGVDFKIEEGRNTIGSASSSDVTISDSEVSSSHALILCKKNKFILTDELSSNGTLLNDEDLIPRNTYDLNDGDVIKVGHTSLLFKQAFK